MFTFNGILAQFESSASSINVANLLLTKSIDGENKSSFVRYNPKTNCVSSIIGFSLKTDGTTPKERIEKFLSSNKSMFRITSTSNSLIYHKSKFFEEDNTTTNIVKQYYKGIEVVNGGYTIIMSGNGNIIYLSGDYYPDIDISIDTRISSEQAEKICLNQLADNISIKSIQSCLKIYVYNSAKNNGYQLYYDIEIKKLDYNGSIFFWVDAISGNIIMKGDGSKNDTVTGYGTVALPDPLYQTSNNQPLYNLIDADPDMQKLNGTRVKVYTIIWEGRDYHLLQTAESAYPLLFDYPVYSTAFKETNAYYHAESFRQWMVSRGIPQSLGSIDIYVNDKEGTAKINYPSGPIHLGKADDPKPFGDGKRDAALDAQVIAHEYVHRILFSIYEHYQNFPIGTSQDTLNYYAEWLAMEEAYCDYFALGYTNQWKSTDTWGDYRDDPEDDAEYNYNWEREYLNNYTYIDDFNNELITASPLSISEYDRACIFGDGLWRFRRDPDVSEKQTADFLVRKSITWLDSHPTFIEGRDALIAAADWYGETCNWIDDIEQNFQIKGIGTATPIASIDGPDALYLHEEGTYTAQVEFGKPPFAYAWYGKPANESTWWPLSPGNLQTQDVLMGAVNYDLGLVVTDDENRQTFATKTILFGIDKPIAEKLEVFKIPDTFYLAQNYPNPFNPETDISFGLSEDGMVRIDIYNIKGQKIITLVKNNLPAGHYSRKFNPSGLTSGIYFYIMSAGEFKDIKRMVLIK
jgi:hypothetical protein